MPEIADLIPTMKALVKGASAARVVTLTGAERSSVLSHLQSLSQAQAVYNQLVDKGYTFNPANAEVCRATLHASTEGTVDFLAMHSDPKADQTLAIHCVAEGSPSISPDVETRVCSMGIVTNNRPTTVDPPPVAVSQLLTYYYWNGMPLFFVTVLLWVPLGLIWPYYYWWYDSHRHRNWWYKCYFWWWCTFKSWWWGWPFWWNWWFGWVFYRYFYGWSWHIPW